MKPALILLLLPLFSASQHLSPRLDTLKRKIFHYTYSSQYDSAQSLTIRFLEENTLDTVELFYGNFYYGDILKSSGKPEDAIPKLNDCRRFLQGLPGKKKYESLILGNLAECYFNLQDFAKAASYARLSVLSSPDTCLRSGGHAINYIITGFESYRKKKYASALEFYSLAMQEFLKRGELCELPLCYIKMAKAYNSSGNENLALKNIEKALQLSDSCGIKHYTLLSKYTLLDLFKENKKYREALNTLEEINTLVKEMEHENQRKLVKELEVKYETQLTRSSYENMRDTNSKNEKILSQQKWLLTSAIIALFILSGFIFLLVRNNLQRKKNMNEIKHKNLQIEKQNEELKRLNMLNQKIFSVISHDFRGPVISLQLLLKTLSNKNLNSDQITGYTEDISHQFIQIKHVLENLLNWARTELNIHMTGQAFSEPFSIATEISTQLQGVAAPKHISILNAIPEELQVPIPPDILRIIFRNLLSNAIKFSFENSEVHIGYDAGTRELIIKDSGIGINDYKMKLLFSQNIHPSLGTWKESGFGLGLYITNELLYRYHSSIVAEPNVPKGTVFRLKFSDAETVVSCFLFLVSYL